MKMRKISEVLAFVRMVVRLWTTAITTHWGALSSRSMKAVLEWCPSFTGRVCKKQEKPTRGEMQFKYMLIKTFHLTLCYIWVRCWYYAEQLTMYLDILWSLLSMMHAIDWSDTLVSAAGGEPGKVCRMGWGSGVVRCSTPEEWTLAYHRHVFGRYEGWWSQPMDSHCSELPRSPHRTCLQLWSRQCPQTRSRSHKVQIHLVLRRTLDIFKNSLYHFICQSTHTPFLLYRLIYH